MKNLLVYLFLALCGISVLSAQSDTQAPKLVSMTISPSSVDVTLADRQVTFSMQITDDLSGVNLDADLRVQLWIRSPSRAQVASALATVQSGVILNAAVTITVTIPRYAEPGTWTIDYIRLTDNAGNAARPNGDFLASAGFPIAVNVIDATPDYEAPKLVAISLSPRSLDVSASDMVVTVEATVTDDASGFRSITPKTTDFEITSPSLKQSRFIPMTDWKRISGSTVNGVWRASFVMPRFSEPGVWRIASLRLNDRTGRIRLYPANELASFGTAIELLVASSSSDVVPPVLRSLSFNQAAINTSAGSQTVVAQMTLSDDLAGVSFAPDRLYDYNYYPHSFGGLSFQSPSGAQTVNSNYVPSSAVLVAGTPLNGIWSFDAVFPQYCEEGTWTATVRIKDATRNVYTYSGAQLAALGLPNSVVVIRPSLQQDGNPIDAAGGTVVDDTFGTRAQLIVPPGSFSQPTSVAIDVLLSPVQVALPAGVSGANTYFVNVELTPKPLFPLAAPGITVVLPLKQYGVPGTHISLYRIDTVTNTLEPALDVFGGAIVGHVDAGGQTATFSGVSRFSTVTGILTDEIIVLPTDVTSQLQITRGGYILNRTTRRYVQTITVTNTSAQPITGPFNIVLSQISSNATMYAPVGTTTAITPIGSSYVSLNVGSDNVLNVGESAKVNFEFSNPSNQVITYNLRAFAGPGSR